ncbi:DUF6370 family protein [Pedobacter sp. Leaf170]|uniref:DUF6370 family protein n=1 Tax=Pedobacter sp. Leaf170 TaxID=2876558 RepID=UPI001E2F1EE3|nr:DUF6370 family protein [Pedobacter sp. Leaf170]
MKSLPLALFISAISLNANTQTSPKKVITKQVVDIACGECQFKMLASPQGGKGKSCDLAIRIDGKPYFVDGKNIDDFGDAHGEHGFCNAVSKAEVSGEIVKNRFKAKEITILPIKKSL